MKLTKENYYSKEANMEYMSVSQWKDFRDCPARALATVKGEYTPPTSTALLVGGYVDAHFSGEANEFVDAHPEIFKKDGTLKAEYVAAQKMINRFKEDELLSALMSGEKQVIVTGDIAGVKFKGKIDSLLSESDVDSIDSSFPDNPVLQFVEGLIVDQKAMKDFSPVWSDDAHAKVSFIEAWGYDKQGAVYQELGFQTLGKRLPFVIAGVSKEDEPDITAQYIPQVTLDSALFEVEDTAPIYAAMKRGEIVAPGCGHCAYCRAKKKLTKIINYKEA